MASTARPVSDKEALGYACPKCLRPEGVMCVRAGAVWESGYVQTPYGKRWTRRVKHQAGSPLLKVHSERREAVLAQDLWERQQAQPRVPDRQRTIDALMEFDRREHMALRRWLREHGEILWKDARPDGTWRGESYW